MKDLKKRISTVGVQNFHFGGLLNNNYMVASESKKKELEPILRMSTSTTNQSFDKSYRSSRKGQRHGKVIFAECNTGKGGQSR